jgi:hypothetical protein
MCEHMLKTLVEFCFMYLGNKDIYYLFLRRAA